MPTWASFEYREFYDVPRYVVVPACGHLILLVSGFRTEVRFDPTKRARIDLESLGVGQLPPP